jgi:hypothetical protein
MEGDQASKDDFEIAHMMEELLNQVRWGV